MQIINLRNNAGFLVKIRPTDWSFEISPKPYDAKDFFVENENDVLEVAAAVNLSIAREDPFMIIIRGPDWREE